MLIVPALMLTTAPATMDTVLRLRSSPEVPTLPSAMAVPEPLKMRNQVAVPVLSADESLVMAAAVATDGLAVVAAPNAVALNVRVASSVPVTAVSVVAGRVPERMASVPRRLARWTGQRPSVFSCGACSG
jgi:hypothetical protein